MENLNWNLTSTDDRIEEAQRLSHNASPTMLTFLADYILYSDGWKKPAPDQNVPLDGLPQNLDAHITQIPYTSKLNPLNRSTITQYLNPYQIEALNLLWAQIDELDYKTAQYKWEHNLRKTPPRSSLINSLALHISQYNADIQLWRTADLNKALYKLKKLRAQQYDIVGTNEEWRTPLQTHWESHRLTLPSTLYTPPLNLSAQLPSLLSHWDIVREELNIKTTISAASYQKTLSTQTLPHLYTTYTSILNTFMRDPDYRMTQLDLGEWGLTSLIPQFFEYLLQDFTHSKYASIPSPYSILQPEEQLILVAKLQGRPNKEIAHLTNTIYNKHYNENYISTIYLQRIPKKLNDQHDLIELARKHINEPQKWQTCPTCGKTYLLNPNFYAVRSRKKSGFDSKCKDCRRAEQNNGR